MPKKEKFRKTHKMLKKYVSSSEEKTKKIKEKKPCPEGQERSEKGHCKKIKVEKEKKTRKIKKKLSSKKSSSKKSHRSSSGSWSNAASSKLSNISDLISEEGDELNEEQRKEFDDIIKNLQEGQLKGMNLDAKGKPGSKGKSGLKDKPNSKELSINCLKMFDDIALEKELDKRKKEKEKEKEKEEEKKPAVNILVPRKKVPKA